MSRTTFVATWVVAFSAALVLSMRTSHAAPSEIDARWLVGLTERVIRDLEAGRPLVVEVHVPLAHFSGVARRPA